jgi:hypothetical protein
MTQRERIPYINVKDPLPAQKAPTGRWGTPYIRYKDDQPFWVAFRRQSLTKAQEEKGLTMGVEAKTKEGVFEKIAEQDDLEDSLANVQHRNTLP